MISLGVFVGSLGRVNADPATSDAFVTAKELRESGWKAPYPPYPAAARMQHENGWVYLHLKTDADGKIAEIKIADRPESAPSESLKKSALGYVRNNWHGPPNAAARVKILFQVN